MVATLPKSILRDTGEPTAPVDSINPDVPATPIADAADPTGAPARKRQRTAPASPDLASAFAQYQQRCVEARAAFDAIVEENLRLVEDKGGLETELARTKTALGAAEQDAQAAVAHTQVLEGTVARLKAAAAEDQAALLLPVGKNFGVEKEEYERVVAELREKVKALEAGKREAVVPVEIDSTMSVRKQIDASVDVMAKLLDVFVGCEIQDGLFDIVEVGKRISKLEASATVGAAGYAAHFIRLHIPKGSRSIVHNDIVKFAGFNDIITSLCGANNYPKFNALLASLRQMGIATDLISAAAFSQHSRNMTTINPVVIAAIRGKSGMDWRENKVLCQYVLRTRKCCPKQAKKGTLFCSRHT